MTIFSLGSGFGRFGHLDAEEARAVADLDISRGLIAARLTQAAC